MIEKPNAQPNQSLIDGFTIVNALVLAGQPVGGRELARQLGFEPTRVNRLLKTLAFLGVARQTPSRKYTVGPAMHVMAAHDMFASGVLGQALPLLESLRHFNLTVAFGVLWRFNVTYLYHAPPGMASADALGRKSLYPATKGGIGLVMLAELPVEIVRAQYAEGEIPGFESVDALLAKLDEIRENGYARVLVNTELDHHTIAVPVGEPAHAAVALSGWIPEANAPDLVAALREIAAAIDAGATA